MRPPPEFLFPLARRGSPRAFGSMTEELGAELHRFLTNLLHGDEHAARDAVQETLFEAWKSLSKIESFDHLRRWSFTVARCRAVSWLRRRAPPGALLFALDADPPSRRDADEPGGVPRMVDRAQARQELLLAIDRLPPRYGGPIRLHYLHGLDTWETARLLGLPRTNVKMRLHRGRIYLRRALQLRSLGPGSRATPQPRPEAP